MSSRSYWLNLFSGKTWEEFVDAGSDVTGFRESRWTTVQKIEPGDYLLCYVTGISRFIGILEAVSEGYKDDSQIWEDAVFPCRIKVNPIITLSFETAIPIHDLKDELTIFENMSSPQSWTGWVRGSPTEWKESDGKAVVKALERAKADPVKREVDSSKLKRRPRALKSEKMGSVTIPDDVDEDSETDSEAETDQETTSHTKVQHSLLRVGDAMGFDVWVARNDQSRTINGQTFSELFDLKERLPVQFDEATMRIIEYIDVLWLKRNRIEAAFEIESTTSIYSGLLRMSDLLAMQPNLKIPLYLVAPEDRRDKVIREINRPTFSRLRPPLVELVRYVPFRTLRKKLKELESIVGLHYLKPNFMEAISEDCYPDEV